MSTITGTNGNDNLVGTADADTIDPLLGKDVVDGLQGTDLLVVDYGSVFVDPFAGAAPANVPSTVTSSGGTFNGAIKTVDGVNTVTFSNIEQLQVTLDSWHDTFTIDASALAFGATISLNGGDGTDTLDANLSALASVDLQFDPGGTTASFGTIVNFEVFKLNLTSGADHVTTGSGADTLTGNGGDDVLSSGGGNDILSGGTGTNILNAGDGDDQLFSAGIDTVDGGSGGFNFDRWTGDYSSSTANLTFIRDTAAGNASLSNGTTLTGVESISGLTTGSGNDVFIFTTPAGIVEQFIIAAGAGEDSLSFSGSAYSGAIFSDGAGAFAGGLGFDRFSGIEHLTFVSASLADFITVDATPLLAGATLSLDGAGGTDTIALQLGAYASVSFVASAGGTVTTNVPITLANFEAYQIYSGGGDDLITTAAGNDTLDGGAGADALTGGAGNDSYVVDNIGDAVNEGAGGGWDALYTSISYTLAAGIELEGLAALDPAGTTALNLTGNAIANYIVGNAGSNVLDGAGGGDTLEGRGGNDYYLVDNAADRVIELFGGGWDAVYTSLSYALTAGSDVEGLATLNAADTTALNLTGNEIANYIVGNAGSNVLDGALGADTLEGGAGNDYYVVDDAGDRVIESTSGGWDAVYTMASFTLTAGSEIEGLATLDPAGIALFNLTGNEIANYIVGNAGSNVLDGRAGADTLEGLGGNDNYVVDSAGDVVIEAVGGGGFDAVYTSVSYTLAAGQDTEGLATLNPSATMALNLTGNEIANYIVGNAGSNVLDGAGGNDTLEGGSGNDYYIVDSAGDQVIETVGGDWDAVYVTTSYTLTAGSDIEGLATLNPASTAALDLTGNAIANYIVGNAGANVIDGKSGADIQEGGGGADTFAFTTALGGGNVDQILDFQAASDRIALDDAIFAGLTPGTLAASAFVTGSAAGDADDRIIYNSATGQLYFDADGNGAGAAVLFATLSPGLPLTNADFMVI